MAQDLSLNISANTSNAQASIGQLATLTEAQMKRIASFVKAATDQQNKMASAVKDAANSSSYQTLADGASKAATAHAGMTRELLVLGHELSQGNFKRFGGSMLVLAEYSTKAQAAIATLTGPVGVLVAVAGAVGVGMTLGALNAEKFAKSLQLTGNYAAVTASQLKLMADAQALRTGQTTGGARGSLEEAAGSGLFSQAQLAVAARAMGDYQRLTGETAAEALKHFQSIQDGVARWALEENKSVHFLTAAEYDHIKAMEDTGDKQGAAIAALTAYAQTIESRGAPALGTLAKLWHFVAEAASQAGQAMLDAGKPSTLQDAIDDEQRKINWARSGNSGGSYEDRQRTIAASQSRLRELMQQQAAAAKRMSDASSNAAAQQAAIEGKAYEEGILRQAHALSERTKELEKWQAQRDKDKAAGHPMSDADYKAGVAEINQRYAKQPGAAQANQYSDLRSKIMSFNEATEEERSTLEKLTEGQRLVLQTQQELARSSDKMTAAQRASIAADAAKAGALRDIVDASNALKKSFTDDSDRAIKESIAAATAQQRAVENFRRSGTTRVADIDFQTSLVGKSPEEAAKAQAMRSIDLAANQALEAASGQRLNDILAEQVKQRADVAAAMDRETKAQEAFTGAFSEGWDQAAANFVKQSNDQAAAAQKIFNDTFSRMGDSIAKFAESGKLSIGGLLQAVADDLIRMEVNAGLAALIGPPGGGTGSGFMSLLGIASSLVGGNSATASVANALPGDSLDNFLALNGNFAGGALASGIDYVPYNGMPAILHEGERVMTKIQNQQSKASGGPTVHVEIGGMTFGAGVNASGVAQAVTTGMAQVKAEISRALSTTGRIS